jgi:hypothetical protein
MNGMAADFYRFSVSGASKENDLTDDHIPQPVRQVRER